MCVLVIVVQCLHLIVCLSIPFSTFHFMTGKNVLALHFLGRFIVIQFGVCHCLYHQFCVTAWMNAGNRYN